MADLVVYCEAVDMETGLWCEQCALPSVIRVHMTMTTQGRTTICAFNRCVDHEPVDA